MRRVWAEGGQPEAASKGTNEIQQLHTQLDEQTKRIDRIYYLLGPHLKELEEDAASREEFKKAQAEEAAKGIVLKLETLCVLTNQGLTAQAMFSPSGGAFAVITRRGSIQVFTVNGKLVGEVAPPEAVVTSFVSTPDGQRLVVGTSDGRVLLQAPDTGKWQPVFSKLPKPVSHLVWLPSPDRLVVAYNNARGEYANFIIRLADGQVVTNFASHWQITAFQNIAGSADGKLVGASDLPNEERAGYLLDANDASIKAKLRDDAYQSGALSIAIAPDNNTVAVGHAPYHLSLWDAAHQKELRLVKAHSNWVTALAFSPDSRRLISGGGDGTARIWDVATGEEIGRISFEGNSTYVNSVGFSADGKLVLAAAENDELIVAKAPE